MSQEPWANQARAKKNAVLNLIPTPWQIPTPTPSVEDQRDVTGEHIWQYLNDREKEITETNAEDIVRQTSAGQWTAEEVVRAFAHRASVAHQVVNCLHEIFFESAYEDAKKLDAYYAEHRAPIGPLHGLPVSLKDQFHVKGVETTMGYVGWIGTFEGKKGTGKEKVYESELVRELRNLGAVLYCKTSVPQTLMTGETVNNIIGYTWNPKNRNLSCGGSSGGEGALLAMKGSPLGFGTDIGGSIRIPAAFCGQYGLRPSTGRLPYEGMANSMDGQNTILSVVGPLSTSLGGLRLAMKSLLSQEPWLYDPLVHQIPWRSEMEDQVHSIAKQAGPRLAFGIVRDDGGVPPFPPVSRALNLTAEALEAMGHKIIEWNPPPHTEALQIAAASWTYDGGADIFSAFGLSGEPVISQIEAVYGSEPKEEVNASRIAAVNVAKRRYQKAYLDYWNDSVKRTGTGRPVDALISPVAPFPAARPERYLYYGYSVFVNLLDYPAVVVPVTVADKIVDARVEGSDQGSEGAMSGLRREVAGDYDAELYHGAAVGLQILGRRLQEEKTLAIAEEVVQALEARKQ